MPKSIIGIILILLVIATYLGLLAMMGAKAGGGIIIIIPVFMTIRYLWNNMVIQKVKIHTPITNVKLEDIPKNDVLETTAYTPEIAQAEILSINSNLSRGYFKRVIEFFTYQSPTYRSVFDEGQRRIIMIASLIAPFIMSYMWFYDFDDSYIASDWYIAAPLFYLVYHLIMLLYIWIREGQGKVREGGNALKTLKNAILSLTVVAVIIGSVGLYYETVYIPQQNEKEMRLNFEQYHKNLVEKDWDGMERILSFNTNKMNSSEYVKGLANDLDGREFIKWDVSNIRTIDRYTLVGRFTYTIKTKKETHSKNVNTTMTFLSTNKIEKVEFTVLDE